MKKNIMLLQVLMMLVLAGSLNAQAKETDEVLTALAQCQPEFTQLMDGVVRVELTLKARATVINTENKRERLVQTIVLTSYTNGVAFFGERSKKYASLTMRGDLYDSHLFCDSDDCTTYSCELNKY